MNLIISFAALAVTSLALQSLPAKAQDSTSSSGSTSSSSSSSGAVSGSRSQSGSSTSGTSGNQQRTNQRVNTNSTTNIPITFNSADPAGGGGAGASAGGQSSGSNTPGGPTGQPYYGQSDVTVRTTPTVYAPPVSGGNPCTLAVSGGVSVIGWGADRQKIAMIWNAGFKGPAKELMCNDRKTYDAFKTAGEPCAIRAQWEAPGTPRPTPMPVAAPSPTPAPMAAKEYPRCNPRLGITDNCRS